MSRPYLDHPSWDTARQILWICHNTGMTFMQIAEAFDVPYLTVCQINKQVLRWDTLSTVS